MHEVPRLVAVDKEVVLELLEAVAHDVLLVGRVHNVLKEMDEIIDNSELGTFGIFEFFQ